MTEPIDVPSDHTAPDDRLGADPSFPIDARAPEAGELDELGVPRELSGLPAIGLELTGRDVAPDSDALVFYAVEPVDGMLLEEVYASGGLMLDLTPLEDAVTYEMMDARFPGRIVPVEVGPWRGGLNWADPDPLGNRPFGVMWTDDVRGYWLSGLGEAQDLLTSAREVACGQG